MNSQVILTRVDQVLNALVVDFDHADVHRKHDIFTSGLDASKESADHARNDALLFDVFNIRACHSVSLARRCLSVSKDSAIKAVKDRIDDRLRGDVIDLFLIRLHIENSVEGEVCVLLGCLFLDTKYKHSEF